MHKRIETKRLLVLQRNEEIADQLLTFYDENRQEFEAYDPLLSDNFYTVEYQRAVIRYEQKEIAEGTSMHYYVYLREDPDTIIGNIDFHRIRPNPFFSTIISYRFHHAYQGKGYATEALQSAISAMYETTKLHRMEARVAVDNEASIRLLKRLGFVYEGREYESVLIHGAFKDHLRYSLLKNH